MSYQPFYITQYEQDTGQENYFQNFLLPEKAFPVLRDAYCWRGRVQRRQGFYLLGRLRRALAGVTLTNKANGGAYAVADLLADAAIDVRAPAAPALPETNAEIEPGSLVITVGALTFSDTGLGVLLAGGGNVGTINYITGALTLTFVPALGAPTNVVITFSYFPALPVMGLRSYTLPQFDYDFLVPFDQKYSYQYTYLTNQFFELTATVPTTWTGNDQQLFWTYNYYAPTQLPLFWVTNFNWNAANVGDPIRYYDYSTTIWTDFVPAVDVFGVKVLSCECILAFKGRLLFFNTWEGDTITSAVNYPGRVRWSQVGNVTDDIVGWLTVPGRGGFLDASTNEHIISVAYLKDVIIVKFEWSSWKLVYTGDEILPFEFQKINDFFGSSSTFSLVDFDDGVYAVGDNAITTDDTTAVERIDIKIPDKVFDIQPSSQRTYGIRDFTNELVYWAYTDIKYHFTWPGNPSYFNNQTLVYNYRNQSWASFNDSWTCFGTFEINPIPAFFPPILPNIPQIIAGNQEGFVEMLNAKVTNSPSLSISAITAGTPVTLTVVNHNFSPTADYWVRIDGIIGGGTALTNPSRINFATSGLIFHVKNSTTSTTFQLETWDSTTNAFVNYTLTAGGTYYGGGTITVIQNFDIQTKVFAPFYEQGMQNLVPYIDILTDTTTNGQYSCNIYLNEYPISFNDPTIAANQGMLGSNIVLTTAENIPLIPMQQNQAKIWHRFFSPYISQNFQLQLKMSNTQMSSYTINNNDFVMHAMTLYLSPQARMTQ
jgi:hypothetical protein